VGIERREAGDGDVLGKQRVNAVGWVCWVKPVVGLGWELKRFSELQDGQFGRKNTIVKMNTLGAMGPARCCRPEAGEACWVASAIQTSAAETKLKMLRRFILTVRRELEVAEWSW
jgi:hypothetical protein